MKAGCLLPDVPLLVPARANALKGQYVTRPWYVQQGFKAVGF